MVLTKNNDFPDTKFIIIHFDVTQDFLQLKDPFSTFFCQIGPTPASKTLYKTMN